MSSPKDDLDATRIIVEALQGMDPADQERALKWSREKLNLVAPVPAPSIPPRSEVPAETIFASAEVTPVARTIKDFMAAKNPKSDTHIAAVVAYYYRFEAAPNERKDTITSDDLTNACRLAGRKVPTDPANILNNAFKGGLLNRKGKERGVFELNAIGENLVAMTLPLGASTQRAPTGRRAKKAKTTKKSTRPKAKKHQRGK